MIDPPSAADSAAASAATPASSASGGTAATATATAPVTATSARLNAHCHCVSLDLPALRAALAAALGTAELVALVEQRCPYLFAARPVFLAAEQTARMAQVVAAIEAVTALPAYREAVLAQAPAIARHDPGGPLGVFFGYDFHLEGDAIGLIEINTNAGGAMLNAVMAQAHRSCALDAEQLASAAAAGAVFEQRIVAMFGQEWALAGRAAPLRTIAIVDAAPAEQYLFAEFLLFQRLFERHGITAMIADPAELHLDDGVLTCAGVPIDLVYNRLTDFMLGEAASATLRQAYLEGAVVLTPHPQAHALYADKQNLTLLGDDARLQALGVPASLRAVLRRHLLATRVVADADADVLWAERKRLFFKPRAGYGSRAAYRGDKLTRRVWQEILAGDYVAQALMAPGQRSGGGGGGDDGEQPASLKFDLRVYAYDGQSQWFAARVYQGQTTNFRTPGGGFAPVYSLAPTAASGCGAAQAAPACCAERCA